MRSPRPHCGANSGIQIIGDATFTLREAAGSKHLTDPQNPILVQRRLIRAAAQVWVYVLEGLPRVAGVFGQHRIVKRLLMHGLAQRKGSRQIRHGALWATAAMHGRVGGFSPRRLHYSKAAWE